MKGRIRAAAMAAATLLPVASALAEGSAPTFKGHVALSRHHTTNALDGPLAVSDWYTLLRGALEETLRHERGETRIAAQLELRRYDRFDIEDDASVSVAAETTLRAAERLELRGGLSLRLAEEGDDLAIGNFLLGTRTARATIAGNVQAGLQLSAATALVLTAAASREAPGDTRFEDDVLPGIRLEPRRDRFRLAATLKRSHGAFSYGLDAASGTMRAAALGEMPRLDVFDHVVRVQSEIAIADGPTLAAAAGLHLLSLPAAAFRELRPTYEIAARLPLDTRLSLRGAFRGAYDIASNDDPVAVWLRRLEIEAVYRAGPALTFGGGFFAQARDFIGMGNGETGRGAYAEAIWQAGPKLALTLRLDVARHRLEPSMIGRESVDAHLAVRTEL